MGLKEKFTKIAAAAVLATAGLTGCQQNPENLEPETKIETPKNYEFSEKKLGGEESAYTIYRYDTLLTNETKTDINSYMNEYKAYVQKKLNEFKQTLSTQDKKTQDYFAPYIEDITDALELKDIQLMSQKIYNSATYILRDTIQYNPNKQARENINNLTKIVLNQSYDKGFYAPSADSYKKYRSKNEDLIFCINIGNKKPSDLKEDIEDNNCTLVITTLDELLKQACGYMNQANKTVITPNDLHAVLNITATVKTTEALLNTIEPEVTIYCAMDDELDWVAEHPVASQSAEQTQEKTQGKTEETTQEPAKEQTPEEEPIIEKY